MTNKDLIEDLPKVYCSYCKGKRNHIIIYTYSEKSVPSDHPEDDFEWHSHYHIIKCAGCNTVAFLWQYGDADTYDIIDGRQHWVDVFKVYPEEPATVDSDDPYFDYLRLEVTNFRHVPDNIKELYKQIVESYNNKHFVLTTSGLRTLVEGICSQVGIRKGYMYDKAKKIISTNEHGSQYKTESLGGRIFGLYENELILFPQALILLEVKEIGNAATHDILVPHFEVIRDIILILEKVMYDIYELKKHDLLIDKV